jgi:bifunctional UDP-N-acetylglucosamine pyrophosphorylase/glucosamine-1-phosphate N-acetyltransferase
MKQKISVIVLAAGKSKRTKTDVPKVLLDLGGVPLIFHILKTLQSLGIVDEIVVVVGHKKDAVEKLVKKSFNKVHFVVQKRLDGTAGAVRATQAKLKKTDQILVVCADTPLVSVATLKNFINFFFRSNSDCAIITALFNEETDYGRVMRDARNNIKAIVEKVNIDDDQHREEVNSGMYCFKTKLLFNGLEKITLNPRKKEYFLTDIVGIFYENQFKIGGYCLSDNQEMLGVNTQQNLARVRKVVNQRIIDRHLKEGISIIDPDTTYLSVDTKIGKNSVVFPFTFIEKNVIIGSNCQVGPFVHLRPNTKIKDNTHIKGSINL